MAISLAISKQKLSRAHEVQKTGLAEQERARRERKSEERAKKGGGMSADAAEKLKSEGRV